MMDDAGEVIRGPRDSNVADYKVILRRVLDNRPSGTRLKLAAALGKNRSFVTQITNPAYLVPIPAKVWRRAHGIPGSLRMRASRPAARIPSRSAHAHYRSDGARPRRRQEESCARTARHRFGRTARALRRECRLTGASEQQLNHREGVYEKADQQRRYGARGKS